MPHDHTSVTLRVAKNRAPERDFDYFPDHCVNQATEPAEPIATF